MVKYLCIRCGYQAKQIGHLKDHLTKNKPCITLFDETDREKLLEMLKNGKEYTVYLDKMTEHIKLSSLVNSQKPIESRPSYLASYLTTDLRDNASYLASYFSRNASYQKDTPNPIESDSMYICNICSRAFNNRQNKWKHEKICEEKKAKFLNNIVDNSKIINNSKNNSDNGTSINNSNINCNNSTTINNTNNTLNVAANNPKMCVFGEEDISHIVKIDRINDYERIARRDPSQVIPTVVKDIYFNNEHPENQTVKIEHIHGNVAMIRTGLPDQWEYVDRKETINKMIRYSINATETGEIDTSDIPKYDTIVNNFYSETNPQYNSTIKAVDTILVIDLRSSNKLLK